jgi:hypothetical protein
MSFISKIPSGLKVAIILVILAVLVWRFGYNTNYFIYSIICAAVILTGFTVAIYYRRGTSGGKSNNPRTDLQKSNYIGRATVASEEDTSSEEDSTYSGPSQRRNLAYTTEEAPPKPSAVEVAAKYRQMAAEIEMREAEEHSWKPIPRPAQRADIAAQPADIEAPPTEPAVQKTEAEVKEANTSSGNEPPLAIVEDKSSLTESDKNELLNGVWYRCENPFCKGTNFLGIHHMVEEKDGGTNKLDNLIVLCPFCHALAHKKEIPEEEMRDWISREERFKPEMKWRY